MNFFLITHSPQIQNCFFYSDEFVCIVLEVFFFCVCFVDNVQSKHAHLEDPFQVRNQIVVNKLQKCVSLSIKCFANYVSLLIESKIRKSSDLQPKNKKRKKGKENEKQKEKQKQEEQAKKMRLYVNVYQSNFEAIVGFFMRKISEHGQFKKLNIKATKLLLRSNLEFIAVLKIMSKAKIHEFENMLNGHLKSKDEEIGYHIEHERATVEEMLKRYNLLNSFILPIQKRSDWENRQKQKKEERQKKEDEKRREKERKTEDDKLEIRERKTDPPKPKTDGKIQSLLDSIKAKKEPRRRIKAKLKELEKGPSKEMRGKEDEQLGLNLIDKFSKYLYEDEYDDTLEAPVKMKFHMKEMVEDRNRKMRIQEQKKKKDQLERQRKLMEESNRNKSSSEEENEEDEVIEDVDQLLYYEDRGAAARKKKERFEGYQEVSKGKSKRSRRQMRGRDVHNRKMLGNKNYWKMEKIQEEEEEEEEEELVYYMKKKPHEYRTGKSKLGRAEREEEANSQDESSHIESKQSEARYNTKKTQSDRHRDLKKRYNKKDFHNKNKKKNQNKANQGEYVRREAEEGNQENGRSGGQSRNNRGGGRGRGRGRGRRKNNRRRNHQY